MSFQHYLFNMIYLQFAQIIIAIVKGEQNSYQQIRPNIQISSNASSTQTLIRITLYIKPSSHDFSNIPKQIQLFQHKEPIQFSGIVRQGVDKIVGLSNKQTLLGRVKRFERRRPKLAHILRFYLIFLLFGVTVLALIPGILSLIINRYWLISIVQRQFISIAEKIKDRHISHVHISQPISKAWFNYHWNYSIGNEKQKYLYLLLEDLLAQMNYHQIYELKQLQRVFVEVYRVMEEDFQKVARDVEIEVNKVREKREFITVRAEQKDSRGSVAETILGDKYEGEKNRQKEQSVKVNMTSSTHVSQKNDLRSKLKTQIDAKYKGTIQPQTAKQQSVQASSKIPQVKSQQQPKPSSNSSNPTTKQPSPQTNPQTPKAQQHQSLNLKRLLSNSLNNSASFSYNMLMYYVLILENVLRYETQLIKQPGFYEIYRKGVEQFVFSERVENLLKSILVGNKDETNKGNGSRNRQRNSEQMFRGLREQVERQVEFVRLIRRTVLMGGNSKSNNKSTDSSIDPHKLLTYLINYRHLMGKHYKSNTKMNISTIEQSETPKEIRTNEQSSSNQIKSTKDIIINYLKLISSGQQDKTKQTSQISKVIKRIQRQDRMIQLAVGNKPFINSLKNLYLDQNTIEETQNQQTKTTQHTKHNSQVINRQNTKQKSQLINKVNNTKSKKQQENLLILCRDNIQRLKSLSTQKLVECVFNTIDQWYNRQQLPYKSNHHP